MKSYRKDGKIFIEIDEVAVLFAAENGELSNFMQITDTNAFLDFCTNNIIEIGNDGDFDSQPQIFDVFDRVFDEAFELGAGCEELPDENQNYN